MIEAACMRGCCRRDYVRGYCGFVAERYSLAKSSKSRLLRTAASSGVVMLLILYISDSFTSLPGLLLNERSSPGWYEYDLVCSGEALKNIVFRSEHLGDSSFKAFSKPGFLDHSQWFVHRRGRTGVLVVSPASFGPALRATCFLVQLLILTLNKGCPHIEYQLYGANHVPHWLSDLIHGEGRFYHI